MWRCIYAANYAARAGPKLLRHTHHVESRDAYVHVSPPLAQELARSRIGDRLLALDFKKTLDFFCIRVYLRLRANFVARDGPKTDRV